MQKNNKTSVIANEKIDNSKLIKAGKIILDLQQELKKYIKEKTSLQLRQKIPVNGVRR